MSILPGSAYPVDTTRYTPVPPHPVGPVICNCACQRCLDGGCCLVPQPWSEIPQSTITVRTTNTLGWDCTSGHDFAPFNEGTIYCRKCGTFRGMGDG